MKRSLSRYKVDTGRVSTFTHPMRDGTLRAGYVLTKWGVVGAYTFEPNADAKSRPETMLSFVVCGHEHRLFEHKSYSARGLAIIAGKFARRSLAAERAR